MSSGAQSISAEQFQQILEVSRMLAATPELDELLEHIAEATSGLLDCERASIFLHDPNTHELCTRVAIQSEEIRMPSTSGIVGHVFTNNQVLHVPRPYEDSRFNPEPDRRSGFVTRNLLTAPMPDLSHKPVGVIQAINSRSAAGFAPLHEAMIQLLADQAGVAIQRYRLQQGALDAVSLRREMELARQVQQAMIPQSPPQLHGLDAAGWTRAASVTGGDAFDIWRTEDGRLGIFVGDASGHGLAPALIVSQTRTMLRAMCNVTPDPHELLACANARLCEDLHAGTFVTAFLGFMSSDGELTWSAAGQGPMLVRREYDARVYRLPPPAPPLGVLPDFTAKRTRAIEMNPGGMLAVLSDGVFEARDPAGEMYDINRVVDLLQDSREQPAAAQIRAIQLAISAWQGSDEPADDQTVVLVKRTR